MSEKALYGMGIALLVIIALLGFMMSVSPLTTAANARAAEAAQLSQQKDVLNKTVEDGKTLETFTKELSITSETLSKLFPATAQATEALQQIDNAAIAAGIPTNNLKTTISEPSGAGVKTGVAECPSGITAEEEGRLLYSTTEISPKDKKSVEKYLLCGSEAITAFDTSKLFNSSDPTDATCKFSADVTSGTKIMISITDCSSREIGLGLRVGAGKTLSGASFPSKDLYSAVSGQSKSMDVIISLPRSISLDKVALFIDNLYKQDRAIKIDSVTYPASGDTTIKSYIYTHTAAVLPQAADITQPTATNANGAK